MNFGNDTLKVQRALLDQAIAKGIQLNEEQSKIWATYRRGHQKVAEALQTFQKDVYVNCMIPIGKRALMKGKLIHTNEVLASLGDGYFAKYSAAGATALCERRIENAEEMLKNLSAERDLLETRMMVSENDLFEDSAGRELVEHWNEDQIAEWKQKHREREREYHQKLAKLKQEGRKAIETEEDLFNRLDQLEIEEELADELNRMEDERYELFGEELEDEEEEYSYESKSEPESEQEEDTERDDKSITDCKEEKPKQAPEVCSIKKSVSFAEPENLSEQLEGMSVQNQEKCSKEDEDSTEDIIRITFTHSENNSGVKSDEDTIETPADIYRLFSKPKSILKRSPNDVRPEVNAPILYSTEEEEEEDEEETVKPSAYEIVVKDIKERNIPDVATENLSKEEIKDTKPVSKFKRDRQLRQ